jgi:hypothetical protein
MKQGSENAVVAVVLGVDLRRKRLQAMILARPLPADAKSMVAMQTMTTRTMMEIVSTEDFK